MSVPRDRQRTPGAATPARSNRHSPQRARGTGEDALEEFQRAVGNAGLARLVDQATARSIEEARGGGDAIAEVPEARLAAGALLGEAKAAGEAKTAGGASAAAETLADVRIHADPGASELASRLGARAFTFGADVFLGPEAPRLGGPDGQAMLRHELTHVLQQGARPVGRPRRVSSPASPAEQEAGAAATAARAAPGEAAVAGAVHRQAEEEEEETLALLPADTLHRELAVDEEEVEAATEESTSVSSPTPTAGNPALTALYDVAVLRNVQAASDALQGDRPDARAAFDALREALLALGPLADAYAGSDRELGLEITAYRNGLNALREVLAPFAGASRSTQDAARHMAEALSEASALRSRLH